MEYRIDTFNIFSTTGRHEKKFFETEAEAVKFGRQQKTVDTKVFLLKKQNVTDFYDVIREIH